MSEIVTNRVEESADPREVPRRVAVFPKRVPARFEEKQPPEHLVMTFPHLVLRELICFQIVVIVLALAALFWNAPLEEIANPQHTPNPAKAPWYFLGLQELLHTFPPLVAGVLIPGLVIVALVVIPYFRVNVRREGLWAGRRIRTLAVLTTAVIGIIAVTAMFHAYSVAVPTALLYALALIPLFFKGDRAWIRWLARRSLVDWIMTWFVVVTTILTLIGTYFRGPGWSWVWPWKQ